MNSHSIFYYPYASFTDDQSPLLKVAAIYFDKLYILDPIKSSSGIIGIQDPEVAKDVALLEDKYKSSPAKAQRRKEKEKNLGASQGNRLKAEGYRKKQCVITQNLKNKPWSLCVWREIKIHTR